LPIVAEIVAPFMAIGYVLIGFGYFSVFIWINTGVFLLILKALLGYILCMVPL
jgi:hypothetical protein